MKARDAAKDPYYAGIILGIEIQIHDFDQRVQSEARVQLRDSDVKSSIRKAIAALRKPGTVKWPAKPSKQEIERLKEQLAHELVERNRQAPPDARVDRRDYLVALLGVEESLVTRRDMAGHSRGYLDYLPEFFEGFEFEDEDEEEDDDEEER